MTTRTSHNALDLTGRSFGKWVVVEKLPTYRKGSSYASIWKCRCECGAVDGVRGGNLLNGVSTRCFACGHGYHDLLGGKFGKWVVIRKIDDGDKYSRLWLCKCQCGNEVRHCATRLTSGKTLQCGSCSRSSNVKVRIRPFEALYRKALRSANRDGHQFTISYEYFVRLASNSSCHYCACEIKFAKHSVKNNGQGYQLDRMDNSCGYITGNLVPCCKRCNHAKGNRFTYEEWYGMTEYLRNHP